MTSDPYLLFEFDDREGNPDAKVFREPVEILTTKDIRKVQDIFNRVESVLEEGFYVAGYVSYEAAPAFDPAFSVHDRPEWPLVWFGVFRSPQHPEEEHFTYSFEVSSWEMIGDYHAYQEGVQEVKNGIERGDTYQVNYTTRLKASFSGDDYAFYKKLIRNQQSSYSAYLNMGERRLLSASPELFFRIHERTITTKPMKGTAKRGRHNQEDEGWKQYLLSSEKERSENLMIVDLLRNDLGRIAIPGSVRVPKLFEVETYPTVHQMTSTVEAELPEGYTISDLFHALFPCGSITGAPKVRTMEYIKRLEASPREVYCGAIGYITPEKEAVFNVPIRTVMIDKHKGTAVYGTGGGVTWDSTSEGEFQELQTKARLLTEDRPHFQLLETMKLDDGKMELLPYHLDRIQASGDYFGYTIHRNDLEEQCLRIAAQFEEGFFKIRLLVGINGRAEIEVHPVEKSVSCVTGALAEHYINEDDPFLYHKTTHRDVYNCQKVPGVDVTLLWNSKEELTEYTIANLVVKEGNEYFTPPVKSGLLAGTFRQHLLDRGIIKEKVLYKREMDRFEEMWMINAVRGWTKVNMRKNAQS